MEPQAASFNVNLRPLIAAQNLPQRRTEFLLKSVHALIIRAKLRLDRGPLDEDRPQRINPVQPLCQPAIDIEGKGRMGQCCKVFFVNWHGMILQATKIIVRKPDERGP